MAEQIRCKGCGRLFGELVGGNRLIIKRGDMVAIIEGPLSASFFCSRVDCQTRALNQVHLSFDMTKKN
jgi:hypothetical protein